MKINLIIATWSGLRRLNSPAMKEYYTDSSLFLKKQIISLKTFAHQLDQITFVIPKNPNEPKEFRRYLQTIPSQIKETKVVILERENIGLSYGSFSYAFETYREGFDYYIFLEDDYLFVEDNFDSTLIELLEKNENCGYLAATVYRDGGRRYPDHPSNFNGITKSTVLTQLWKKHGKLPYSPDKNYSNAENKGQVAYGVQIRELGYKLCDLTPHYELPFMWNNGTVGNFGKKNSKFIILPAQLTTNQMLYKGIKLL